MKFVYVTWKRFDGSLSAGEVSILGLVQPQWALPGRLEALLHQGQRGPGGWGGWSRQASAGWS